MKKSVMSCISPINTQAAWQPWLRPVARVVIGAHLALALQPLSALAQEPGASADNPVAQAQVQRLFQWQQKLNVAQATKAQASQAASSSSTSTVASDRTARNLGRAQDLVRSLRRASGATSGGTSTAKAMAAPSLIAKAATTVDAETQALSSALDAIDADTDAALAEFHQLRQGLIQQGVSNDILLRHDQTEAELQNRATTLRSLIQAWRTGPSSTKLAAISDYFDRYPAGKKPLAIDPQKLPWSTPKPNTRAPATTKTAWFQNLYGKESVRLAQAGGSVGPIQFNIPPAPGEAPTAADLAPTPEVQLTAAIQAQAQALGNNPVNIHNWVRNQVEWVPTWGSIQGAQDTLDKKRGNSFDIASLEIALLRAANIPARYQLGTVEIPAAQMMNWVGGVQKPEAAVVLLNQGGIAATGLSNGGSIQAIRMEHVWVQAYVNWAPGRGSQNANANQHVNPNGPLNAWVPLDASYKQYSYAPGMDLKTAVPLDANALLQAAQQGATVNQSEGWVQNLNQAAIASQLNSYQTRLKAYIDS